ncbi:hypothetical protein ACFE04_004533 [Oxalis oulophora]
MQSESKEVHHRAWLPYPPAAPTAAMVMQHHMMPGQHYPPPPPPPPPHHQHYMAYHHQYQHPPQIVVASPQHQGSNTSINGGGGGGENKTIWVGDLHHWMDENYLHTCFASTAEIASIKVIRNKQTGLTEGYGFVEFLTHATAEKVLQNYPGIAMPNTEQPFRLNWATFSTGDKRSDNAPDLSIFVGDLAADVTDTMLLEKFSAKYPSVKNAKVVFDASSGRSKGYGFVRFGNENERSKAMTEMNGEYCSSRPMRIGAATPRKSSGYQQGGPMSNGSSGQGFQCDGDSTNTTHAEEALGKLNGEIIGKQTVRLSWGRNPANKQFRSDFGNQWSGAGAYYGGQVYDSYGYAMPAPHDPSMYAAAYGAYPFYGSHQQQNADKISPNREWN